MFFAAVPFYSATPLGTNAQPKLPKLPVLQAPRYQTTVPCLWDSQSKQSPPNACPPAPRPPTSIMLQPQRVHLHPSSIAIQDNQNPMPSKLQTAPPPPMVISTTPTILRRGAEADVSQVQGGGGVRYTTYTPPPMNAARSSSSSSCRSKALQSSWAFISGS